MKCRVLTSCDKEPWDELVSAASASGFMQSWAWSVFKQEDGQKVVRLGLEEDGHLIGGAIVYYVESALGTSPLMLPQGPVLPWSDELKSRRGWECLLEALTSLAREVHAPALRLEPGIPPALLDYYIPTAKRAPVDLVPPHSLYVKIDRPDEEILASMKPKGRYNIRLALRKGVEVSWGCSPFQVDEFFNLFELTTVRHGFSGEPIDFFRHLVRALSTENRVRVYLANYRGMTTAALVLVTFGKVATYLYGGSLPFCTQAMSSYALHWQAMQDAREAGCQWYDFYGIAPGSDPTHPYARFTSFKSKFGGTAVHRAGAHDVFFYDQFTDLWLRQMEAVTVNA